MTTAARRAALRALLRADDLDGLLVTDLVNVRYLTGFTGSNGALLLSAADDAHSRFGTDGRYVTQAAAEVADLVPVVERATSPRGPRTWGSAGSGSSRTRSPWTPTPPCGRPRASSSSARRGSSHGYA
jgi:Xaa-Pro aminopeptidase